MTKTKKQKITEGIQCWYADGFKCEVIKKYKFSNKLDKYWVIKLITEKGKQYSENSNLIVPEYELSFDKKEHDVTILYDKYFEIED